MRTRAAVGLWGAETNGPSGLHTAPALSIDVCISACAGVTRTVTPFLIAVTGSFHTARSIFHWARSAAPTWRSLSLLTSNFIGSDGSVGERGSLCATPCLGLKAIVIRTITRMTSHCASALLTSTQLSGTIATRTEIDIISLHTPTSFYLA